MNFFVVDFYKREARCIQYRSWDCFRTISTTVDIFIHSLPPEERLFWNCYLLAEGNYEVSQQLYMQQPFDEIQRMMSFKFAYTLYQHTNDTT